VYNESGRVWKEISSKCCKSLFLGWYLTLWCSSKIPDLCSEATRFESRQWHWFPDKLFVLFLSPCKEFLYNIWVRTQRHIFQFLIHTLCYFALFTVWDTDRKVNRNKKPSIPLKVWVRRPGSKSSDRISNSGPRKMKGEEINTNVF